MFTKGVHAYSCTFLDRRLCEELIILYKKKHLASRMAGSSFSALEILLISVLWSACLGCNSVADEGNKITYTSLKFITSLASERINRSRASD